MWTPALGRGGVKMKRFILICLLVLATCSVFAKPKKNKLQVSYNESGTPISKDNLFIVNYAAIGGDVFVKNASDAAIKVYSSKDNNWNDLGNVKIGNSFYIPQSKNPDIKYICLEYLGTNSTPFTITFDKSFLSTYVILGCPAPAWSGDSYEKISKTIINESLTNPDANFIIQSLETGTPNSAGGVDINIKFWNLSEKIIKYVYFTVEAYNRVDDIAVSTINGESIAIVKVIDFIEKNHSYNASWENVWYNNSISYFKIKNIKIIYKDNTESIIPEKSIPSITGINPISCKLFENDSFSIISSYDEGRVYFYVISDSTFEMFNIHFETTPKTLYSKLEKNIDIEFKDLTKKDSILNGKAIQAIHPNYKNGLLYELLSFTISYKKIGENETVINISDEKILNKIKNYSFVIESLGLR
jgi:hypothetical protein